MSEPYRPGYAGGMANSGGSRGKSSRGGRPARARTGAGARPAKQHPPRAPRKKAEPVAAPEPEVVTGTFVLGAIPGATLGGWIDAWRERMPRCDLDLRRIAFASQRAALLTGEVDAALVRLPFERASMQVITLYDEVPVVVCAADSHLSAVDELNLADLAGEIVIVPADDVLAIVVPGAVAPAFDAPHDTEQAIATVAAGVGIVIVPMSLARLHQRKDVTFRPLRDGPVSTVALAWPDGATSPAVEAFIGIVRGRTANSSRR